MRGQWACHDSGCGKLMLKILKTTLITINSYTMIPWVLLLQFGIVKNILYGNLL